MKPVCEVMVLKVFPGLRAMIARKLVEQHGFSQKAAAEKLGTSQPAISQYKRDLRGTSLRSMVSDPGVMETINTLADRIAKGQLAPEEISSEFCTICKHMRKHGLACDFHRRMYPSLENCTICMDE